MGFLDFGNMNTVEDDTEYPPTQNDESARNGDKIEGVKDLDQANLHNPVCDELRETPITYEGGEAVVSFCVTVNEDK